MLRTPDLRERLAEWWEEVWSIAHWVRNVLLWPVLFLLLAAQLGMGAWVEVAGTLLLWRRGRQRPVPPLLTAAVVLGFLLLFARETWRWATDDPYVGPYERFLSSFTGAADDLTPDQ